MHASSTQPRSPRRLVILGSTGSIGRQTLDVVRALNRRAEARGQDPLFQVVGLAAGANGDLLAEQASEFDVRDAALANGASECRVGSDVHLHRGDDSARDLVESVDADIVLAAMVGAAGLPATLAALDRGVDVALANKETLVAAGELVVPLALRRGARLLPVDSEHSAIWQCLGPETSPPCALGEEVVRITLTASGGPFLKKTASEVYNATPEQALAHPTWDMGAKVTIDSASLTNKALEVIEAHWLFGLDGERIAVVVHPQSIIHSFVEFADQSVLAQLGAPDMRTPIQFALTFPERPAGIAPRLDPVALSRLDFEPPDLDRFPALGLAFRVIDAGGVAGAIFNGANEAAVEAFLDRRIPFGRIPELSAGALDAVLDRGPASSIRAPADVLDADAEGRRFVSSRLAEATPAG